jgi:hypothetical protein
VVSGVAPRRDPSWNAVNRGLKPTATIMRSLRDQEGDRRSNGHSRDVYKDQGRTGGRGLLSDQKKVPKHVCLLPSMECGRAARAPLVGSLRSITGDPVEGGAEDPRLLAGGLFLLDFS